MYRAIADAESERTHLLGRSKKNLLLSANMKSISLYLLTFLVLHTTVLTASAEEEPDPWKLLCDQLKNLKLPEADQPKKEELAKYKDCDAAAKYYGIDSPVDYKEARRCAYAQIANGTSEVFGGPAILMMIYANGNGVSRNIQLARYFVCKHISADVVAPREIEIRLNLLDEISKTKQGKLDICETITSGYMQGHCANLEEQKVEVKRKAEFAKLVASWSEVEKTAFKKLEVASNEFTKARGENEIDLSGSGRAAFQIAEEAIQRQDFLESVRLLEKKKAPRYTSQQFKDEDKKLNELYKKTQSDRTEKSGTVTPEGIKIAQRAWIKYRDAWVEFAKIRYPSYSSDSIAAWFTKKRNHMMRNVEW